MERENAGIEAGVDMDVLFITIMIMITFTKSHHYETTIMQKHAVKSNVLNTAF